MSDDDRAASDAYAQILLELDARFAPEAAARLGVPDLEEAIVDWSEGAIGREIASYQEAERRLGELASKETRAAVRLDLALLKAAANRAWRGREIEDRSLICF